MSGYVGLVAADGVTPVGTAANPVVFGGAGASGAAAVGNPIGVGGVYNSGGVTLLNGQRGDLQLSANGFLFTTIAGSGGGAVQASVWNADGASTAQSALNVLSASLSYNGASYDRTRGNVDTGTALVTLAAQAAGTVNSADQTNYNGRGVQVTVDITAATAMTLTVNIQVKDLASGKYVTVLSSTALAGIGTTLLTVYPGAAVAANISAPLPIGRTWRVQAVVTGTSVTATVGASVIV